jgi:hypothetical protein
MRVAGAQTPIEGTGRHPPEFNDKFERVSWLNLPTKTGTVKTSKKRNLPRVIPAYQDSDRAHLSDRFAHQYARQCWPTRKMSDKEFFVAGELPNRRGRNAWRQFSNCIDKQKWRAMGQKSTWFWKC